MSRTWIASNAENALNYNWLGMVQDLVDNQMIDTSKFDFAVYGISRNIVTDWLVITVVTIWYCLVVFVWYTQFSSIETRMNSFWPDQIIGAGGAEAVV